MNITTDDINTTTFCHTKTGNLYRVSSIFEVEDPATEEWTTWIEYRRKGEYLGITYRRTEQRFLSRFERVVAK